MKKTKLLKSILIPTLGISAIGAIPVVSTSCGEVHVSSIKLDDSINVTLGEIHKLVPTILPENATDKSVTWSSDNESVATIQNGIINAKAIGTANITVTTNDGGLTATCAVTVSPVHVESIVIAPVLATLAVGETKALNVTVLPENATDKSVTWSSNNESIVSVDENGNIIAYNKWNCNYYC